MKKRVIAYWLIPAEPARELFHKIIEILAKEFTAPRFEPHLTIAATPEGQESPRSILRQLKAKPIRLRVRGIGFSSKFTKTLFVRFSRSKSLQRLVVDLGRATKARVRLPADPHLSLVYKKLPPSVKRELASAIKLPFSRVIFDSIKAVRCASATQSAADVKTWRIVATKNLTSWRNPSRRRQE